MDTRLSRDKSGRMPSKASFEKLSGVEALKGRDVISTPHNSPVALSDIQASFDANCPPEALKGRDITEGGKGSAVALARHSSALHST